jgi:hypothetical protein
LDLWFVLKEEWVMVVAELTLRILDPSTNEQLEIHVRGVLVFRVRLRLGVITVVHDRNNLIVIDEQEQADLIPLGDIVITVIAIVVFCVVFMRACCVCVCVCVCVVCLHFLRSDVGRRFIDFHSQVRGAPHINYL